MKKIVSLFRRNYDSDRLVRDEVVPGADWVIAGEGVATRKFDGTCCMVRDGRLYKRYDAKKGKVPPAGFEPAQDPDQITGHWPGWLPVSNAPEDRYYRDAVAPDSPVNCGLLDGTYELCGPKINGNPEDFKKHLLVPHGKYVLYDAPRTYLGLRAYLQPGHIEGIVWWHPDGRMVKIKARDFGITRQ